MEGIKLSWLASSILFSIALVILSIFVWRLYDNKPILTLGLLLTLFYHFIVFGWLGWQPGLAGGLMSSFVIQTMILLALLMFSLHHKQALSGLFMIFVPYGLVMLVTGLLIDFMLAPIAPRLHAFGHAWVVNMHILAAIMGYALIGLAALAAFCVLIKRHGLKHAKDINVIKKISARLPAMQPIVNLQQLFLGWAFIILGGAMVTGIGLNWMLYQSVISVNHKILLVFFGFILAGVIWGLQSLRGLGAKRLATLLLLVFGIFTLAYPGVHLIKAILDVS